MENIADANTYIGIAVGIASLITIIIPTISAKVKGRMVLVIVIIGVTVCFLNSNFFKHWRYFDSSKIYMINGQLPHTFRKGNQFFHKYTLTLENKYSEEINAKNVILTINSRMPILRYEILLSEVSKDSLHVTIKDLSELKVTVDSLSGGQIVTIMYETNQIFKNNLPKNVATEQPDIFKNVEYELFGQHHSCDCWKELDVPLSEKIYEMENIMFEKVIALDHRKVPHELKYDYQYANYYFDNNKRNIEIFCSTDKHLNIIYNGICKNSEYKSIDTIKEKVSLLRVLFFKDSYFLHESTFPTKKIKQAPKMKIAWDGVFKKIDQSHQKNSNEPLATRTFWLLREKGAKISLGCPGEKCFHFELGKFEEKNGRLWQQIYLSGEGLGIKRDLKHKLVFGFDNTIKMKGAYPGLDLKDGRMFASISLREGASFEIFPDVAHIKFYVIDTKSESLRIKLEVWPRTKYKFLDRVKLLNKW